MNYQIEVKKAGKKGRGVYALKSFKKGDLIEKAPVIKMTPTERKHCEKTILNTYMYPWRSLNDAAVVLGCGSIYNHSIEHQNARWSRDYKNNLMVYHATRAIKKGEEILVDYNGPYEPDEESDWAHEVKSPY